MLNRLANNLCLLLFLCFFADATVSGTTEQVILTPQNAAANDFFVDIILDDNQCQDSQTVTLLYPREIDGAKLVYTVLKINTPDGLVADMWLDVSHTAVQFCISKTLLRNARVESFYSKSRWSLSILIEDFSGFLETGMAPP